MRTRKTTRRSITLPGRFFTGLGTPEDVVLTDLSVGGCRFASGARKLPLGAPLQIYVAGSGPHRATVKWVEGGEVGVTFTSPLSEEQFENFRHSHVPDLAAQGTPGDFEDVPDELPQRFC
ncbi:PilZ domain-containing protein [Erythrobacter sp. THAF29]|uniref:PilZ domain-containing protein n=1 Tax=Erythrobacter sp. THAF29 TaxID=2587851 RepID=UPI001268BFE2|nr:PilZ domain-containing protein [Erythrobacter sp. THAF29]QFT76638.1 PilZ domain protein [Erythrobacter sp. THAF29]